MFGTQTFGSTRMSRPNYLPSGGGFGSMYDQGDPTTGKRGKSLQTQHLGSVVGRRGAGISQITGGDQGAHSMNHYGKGGLPSFRAGEDF